jgi:asparagine synthase (glutamine-hydrolysing)
VSIPTRRISAVRRVYGYNVHGFTIANTDARYEEQELVEHAVRSWDPPRPSR